MSKYRPQVRKGFMEPTIHDKSLLVGKEQLTPKERAEWLRKQPREVQEQSREMGERYELIQAAEKRGLLGWEKDYRHYRDGTPYCKCPEFHWLDRSKDPPLPLKYHAGTVAAHNARFDAILENVKVNNAR